VSLPRVEQPADAIGGPHAPLTTRGSETILVVEDEEAVRELIAKALRRYGYEVLVAATPRAALAVASEAGRIHLLISDMVLPEMSGRELASRMLTMQAAMRVLFMSGYTDHAILEGGILQPGMSFLQKPFTPPALANKVREVLGLIPS
jgi:two-component system, cell cycle sensor histidine kinase and response regulator CckA